MRHVGQDTFSDSQCCMQSAQNEWPHESMDGFLKMFMQIEQQKSAGSEERRRSERDTSFLLIDIPDEKLECFTRDESERCADEPAGLSFR